MPIICPYSGATKSKNFATTPSTIEEKSLRKQNRMYVLDNSLKLQQEEKEVKSHFL